MPSPSTETEETTAAAAKQRRVAEDNEFRERVLERHNALRKLVSEFDFGGGVEILGKNLMRAASVN